MATLAKSLREEALNGAPTECGQGLRRQIAARHNLCLECVSTTENDLRRRHAAGVYQRKLEHKPCLEVRVIGLWTSQGALSDALLIRQTGLAKNRQHHGEFGLDFEVLAAKLESRTHHWGTLVEATHANAQAGSLKVVGQRARAQNRPVLAELQEPGNPAKFAVQAYPGKAQGGLRGPRCADIAVVDARVVAFEVKLQPPSQGHIASDGRPSEIGAQTGRTSLDIELWIASGAGVT